MVYGLWGGRRPWGWRRLGRGGGERCCSTWSCTSAHDASRRRRMHDRSRPEAYIDSTQGIRQKRREELGAHGTVRGGPQSTAEPRTPISEHLFQLFTLLWGRAWGPALFSIFFRLCFCGLSVLLASPPLPPSQWCRWWLLRPPIPSCHDGIAVGEGGSALG